MEHAVTALTDGLQRPKLIVPSELVARRVFEVQLEKKFENAVLQLKRGRSFHFLIPPGSSKLSKPSSCPSQSPIQNLFARRRSQIRVRFENLRLSRRATDPPVWKREVDLVQMIHV